MNAGMPVYFAISARAWEAMFCGTVASTVDFDAFAAVDEEADTAFELPHAETDSDTTERLHINDFFFNVFMVPPLAGISNWHL